MSIFGGLMGDIDDDPFLGGHMRRLNNTMLNSFFRDPFGDMLGRSMGPELFPYNNNNNNNNGRMGADVRGRELARFGGQDNFGMGMGMGMGMGLMPMEFPNMRSMFPVMNNPNCLSFSSTSVMTMTSGPDGRPQVYQASQTVKQGPGGVRETKKTVADSRTGVKKMAIGHHINDRAHIVEREQNVYSGEQEQREDFINLDEEESEQFNKEWETKARHFKRGHANANANAIEYNRNGRRRAPRSSPQLALPSSSSQTHHHSSRSNARSSCRPTHHLALTSTAPASVLVSSDSDDGKGEMVKKRKLEHEEKPEKKEPKQKQAKALEKSSSPVPSSSSSSSEKTKPKLTPQ